MDDEAIRKFRRRQRILIPLVRHKGKIAAVIMLAIMVLVTVLTRS